MTVTPIRSVAIIGLGPSGAGAAKAFVSEGAFDRIQVYEKRSDFGGLWNYTKETDAQTTPVPLELSLLDVRPVLRGDEYIWPSPVYDLLDTNVPKDIMTYAGSEFPETAPVFPHRSDVLEYIRKYSEDVRHLVRFNTKVVGVEWDQTANHWTVTSRPVTQETDGANKPTSSDVVEHFDAVVIAVGNYDIPYIPDRKGMKEWHDKHGGISHVKSYRHPDNYKDVKGKIVVVGNSASGGDLAYQLSTNLNRTIYKSRRSENLLPAGQTELVVEVADIERFDAESKRIWLVDGEYLDDVDVVIFATGYLKSYPFLKLPADKPPLLTDGHKVHGTYQHLILYNYPNLAIVGLTRFVLPTRTSESQGCWLSKIWSGKAELPSYDEMRQWELDTIAEKGDGKKFHDLLNLDDVRYCNFLNQQVLDAVKDRPESERGLTPRVWDKEQTALRASLKPLKEAYIRYRQNTGKLAMSYQELIDAKVIDKVLVSDEELAAQGFVFN